MRWSARKTQGVILAAISAAFVGWAAAFIRGSSFVAVDGRRYYCLFDDAMISMRYAWNLSNGAGLVWNVGERVEGYTNLLMTLLMAAATRVADRSPAVLLVQAAGAALLLAVAAASAAVGDLVSRVESAPRRALVRSVTFASVLFYYPLDYWSLMGMETGLLAALLLASVLLALRYDRGGGLANLHGAAAAMGLAFLTRNDSAVFAALLGAFALRASRRAGHARAALGALGLYALFVAAQGLFRLGYYGALVPNTYVLKLTGMPLGARLSNGVGFITPFFTESAALLGLAGLGVALDRRAEKLLLLGLALAPVAYQVYVGGDPWNYWRIPAAAAPLAIVLSVHALDAAVYALREAPGRRAAAFRDGSAPWRGASAALVALLGLAGWAVTNRRFLPELALLTPPLYAEANWRNVTTAVILRDVTTPAATVGVFWAGAIPYYTGLRAIDFLGKSDPRIARRPPDLTGRVAWNGMTSVPGHNKYDLTWSIVALQPTYVQGFRWGSQDVTPWARGRYGALRHAGVTLYLLDGSPAVRLNRARRGAPPAPR